MYYEIVNIKTAHHLRGKPNVLAVPHVPAQGLSDPSEFTLSHAHVWELWSGDVEMRECWDVGC